MSSPLGLPRAVIDTNLVVSGVIIRRGPPRALIAASHRNEFHWLVTQRLLDEYVQVLQRSSLLAKLGTPRAYIDSFLDFIYLSAQPVHTLVASPLVVRDPRDEMVLAAALGGEADYRVTGDDDPMTLADDSRLGRLRIVPVMEFWRVLDST